MSTYRKQKEEFDQQKAAAQQLCPTLYHSFKHHNIPRWFSTAFNRFAKSQGMENHYGGYARRMDIQNNLYQLLESTFDHYGSATLHCGQPCFVMQPYGMTAKRLAACEELAAGMGIKCYLDPASLHYPGNTFSVIFYDGNLFLNRGTE